MYYFLSLDDTYKIGQHYANQEVNAVKNPFHVFCLGNPTMSIKNFLKEQKVVSIKPTIKPLKLIKGIYKCPSFTVVNVISISSFFTFNRWFAPKNTQIAHNSLAINENNRIENLIWWAKPNNILQINNYNSSLRNFITYGVGSKIYIYKQNLNGIINGDLHYILIRNFDDILVNGNNCTIDCVSHGDHTAINGYNNIIRSRDLTGFINVSGNSNRINISHNATIINEGQNTIICSPNDSTIHLQSTVPVTLKTAKEKQLISTDGKRKLFSIDNFGNIAL